MRSSKTAMLAIAAASAIWGCTDDGDVSSAGDRWPDAECRRLGEDFQVDPKGSIDAALRVFRNQVLPRARESGQSFPAYRDWLNEVTDAVRRHEVSDSGEAGNLAQAE